MTTTGMLMFEGMEELDFAGPWEVFQLAKVLGADQDVFSVAAGPDPVSCFHGLRLLPDHTFAAAPSCDVLLIPGGLGTRRLAKDREVIDWIRQCSAGCDWTTSVCTGSLVLAAAGLLEGRRATSHWSALDELRACAGVQVIEGERFVRDEEFVTSAGVSAGIDMALWLVGELHGPDTARNVVRMMQYEPEPPYAAAV